MTNKSLKLKVISCAAVLAVGATAFVSILGAEYADIGLFQQNVHYIKASAQNTLDWNAEYVEGSTGTAKAGKDGIRFETTTTSGTDWHVKLANYSVSVTQYDTYEVTFVLDSSVASTDGTGAIINVAGGTGCWRRCPISVGENVISAKFVARTDNVSVELQLGEFVTPGSLVVVKSVTMKKINNLVLSYNAEIWSDNGCKGSVNEPQYDIHTSTYNFDNENAGEGFGPWNNKLQALTFITMEASKNYEVYYEIKSSVALSGVEILHGRRPNLEYFEKWEQGNEDGKYGVTLYENAIHRFTTEVTPGFDYVEPVISIRPGEKKKGTIELTCLRITDKSNYYGDTIYACNLESGESWKERWQDARGATGGLCAVENKDLVLALIRAYDDLTPAERNSIKDEKDATYAETDFTYAQSVDYFRARFAD